MMIKKLRKRFIIMTMSLVSVVLIATFGGLLYSASNRMETDSFRSLVDGYNRLGSNEQVIGFRPAPEDPSLIKREKPFDGLSHFSTFYISLDDSNEILKIDDFSRELSEDLTDEALSLALSNGEEEGVIRSLNLRYKVFEHDAGKVIGFIDISFETGFIQQQFINYCLIGLGSLTAFFLISLWLSNMAVKPVEKAWQQQQQFVADASHELKTPITVMLANTAILLADKNLDQAKERKWISYIDLEAKRMKKLVEDLLFLARLDASESKLHHRVSLSDAVSEIALPFEAVVFEAGKTLDCDIAKEIVIDGDISQIKQLVSVLLDNAVKYAHDKTAIELRLMATNNKALLSVSNQSDPIPAEEAQQIFDRFYRVDKARGRHQSSYGLGLAIAKEIVHVHKGEIAVSSTEAGTTFTVTFPLKLRSAMR